MRTAPRAWLASLHVWSEENPKHLLILCCSLALSVALAWALLPLGGVGLGLAIGLLAAGLFGCLT